MNAALLKLLNKSRFTNSEFLAFLITFGVISEEFATKLADIENPDENPDILLVKSTPKSALLTSIAVFVSKVKEYQEAIDLPRKFSETEEMNEINRLRLLDFGTIKKVIKNLYENDKTNVDAQKLWFAIYVYKNISKLKSPSIHTHLCKFVLDMESDTYKDSCTALKLTDLISKLKEKNNKYEGFFMQRSISINKNHKAVKPFRKVCEDGYVSLFNAIDVLIKLDPNTDYSEFITKMNGHTYYYNNLMSIKITRAKSKKNPEEKPVNPEDPDIL